nr:hypothetical protein [Tanacetum cinerariifolium]
MLNKDNYVPWLSRIIRNKHFPENIDANLKFLNNLQPKWKRHVTVVRQTKNLHEADFTQIYDFLKMNQDEVNELRAERLAKAHNPLALMAHSQNAYIFPATHNDQSSSSTHSQQSFLINNKIDKVRILEEMVGISLDIMLVKWHRISKDTMHGRMVGYKAEDTGSGNQVMCYNYKGLGHIVRICTARPRRRDDAYLPTQLLIAKKKKQGFNFKRKNLTSWLLQLDKAPVYDTDSSAEVKLNDNHYNNKIFNMFTQEEKYTDLLEPILKPHLVPQNDNHVTSIDLSMVQSGGTVETSSTPNEETQKKKLKHDFKTQKDKYLDKEVDLEAKIKDLENILLKRDQTVQTMHMFNPKPDSFYHPDQKMALGYPNPSYLKKAQLKQQSLYNGNLMLEERDPLAVYDSEETLELTQQSREKMRFLKKEIKPANYAKINHLSGDFVPRTTKSKEELFLSNISNMVTVSKTISIPNEDLSDDTTPSVAQKFLNE